MLLKLAALLEAGRAPGQTRGLLVDLGRRGRAELTCWVSGGEKRGDRAAEVAQQFLPWRGPAPANQHDIALRVGVNVLGRTQRFACRVVFETRPPLPPGPARPPRADGILGAVVCRGCVFASLVAVAVAVAVVVALQVRHSSGMGECLPLVPTGASHRMLCCLLRKGDVGGKEHVKG